MDIDWSLDNLTLLLKVDKNFDFDYTLEMFFFMEETFDQVHVKYHATYIYFSRDYKESVAGFVKRKNLEIVS